MISLTRALGAALLAIATFLPAAHAQGAPAPTAAALDDAARAGVVAKAADALRNRYIFPDTGDKAAAKLEAQLAGGAYKTLAEPRAFADQVTKDLYEVTKDKHLRVMAPGPAPAAAGAPPPSPPPRGEAGVVRGDRLPGNIGYIEVVGFPGPAAFSPVIDKAMAAVGDTKALIIDVRRNGGGSPDSVAYLVSFFLDPAKPILLNEFTNRTPNTKDFTTRAEMSVATPTSYRGKPVYVLTSPRTFSGGEEFAYDMQAFKLGKLVGETTGGGANPGGTAPVGSSLAIFVPNGRPVNAVTKTNWEGVGVIPEIKTPVDEALKVALEKLGEQPISGSVDALSIVKLFEPRGTPTPGLEALARRVIEGDAKGEPALDIISPGMAQAAQVQRDSLMKTYTRLGPLVSLTFQSISPNGGDTYLGVFEYNTRTVSLSTDANGKVNSFFFGPILPQTADQLKASFKAIDLNGDGKADMTEYKTMLEKIGFANLFDSLVAQIDDDKDGFITAKEYEAHPQQ